MIQKFLFLSIPIRRKEEIYGFMKNVLARAYVSKIIRNGRDKKEKLGGRPSCFTIYSYLPNKCKGHDERRDY